MKRIILSSGDILKMEFLTPLKISAYKLAKDIKVSNTLISRILKGKQRITIDIAIKLSIYFQTTIQYWLNIQNNCDLDKNLELYEKQKQTIIPYDISKFNSNIDNKLNLNSAKI